MSIYGASTVGSHFTQRASLDHPRPWVVRVTATSFYTRRCGSGRPGNVAPVIRAPAAALHLSRSRAARGPGVPFQSQAASPRPLRMQTGRGCGDEGRRSPAPPADAVHMYTLQHAWASAGASSRCRPRPGQLPPGPL